jgi:FAD/FMN-containing dehydrogenase
MTMSLSISEARELFHGPVTGPDDSGYDEARTVFYGGIDRRPAAIVRVADGQDVSRVVSLARESGLELAVRSGGHSIAGHSVVDGGIVLDLGEMKGLEIDVPNRTAWAATGLTAGEYTTAAGAHGLATGFGDTGSVGIGGITLGGGIGYLVRKHGMTIDDLLAADIVTADGQLLRVDNESHPDLFWAIRGGGGNFGVATRLKFRLHEINKVVGGILILPATPEVITALVEESEAATDDLSAIVNVMTAPPMPFVPEEYHGRPIAMVLLAHSGPFEDGESVIDRLRKLATPIADMVRPISYPEIYPPEEADYHPVAASRTFFGDTFTRDLAVAILEHLEASTAAMAATQLRALGGAMARVPVDATAFAHRKRALMVNVAALYEDPDQEEQHEAWVAELSSVVGGDPGAYVGFLGSDGQARIREAYPGPTWDRLVDVKRRYDPDNFFHLNQNIMSTGTDAPDHPT